MLLLGGTSLVQAQLLSTTFLSAALPTTSLLHLAAAGAATAGETVGSSSPPTPTTSTSLFARGNYDDNEGDGATNNPSKTKIPSALPSAQRKTSSINAVIGRMIPAIPPRGRSCVLMSLAMALHFGGYEFARSGALALFTSTNTGFSHPSAYPFAIGLVTPVSLLLLYGYGLVLKEKGPRGALRQTTGGTVAVLAVCTFLASALSSSSSLTATASPSTAIQTLLPLLSKLVIGILFVFQNSYAHLIYTQQWSFLGSVMTPTEGTKWFSAIAGLSSVVCTITATMVHTLAERVGLLGLLSGTSITLFLSMFLADRAYQLSETNGFDPSPEMQGKHRKSKDGKKDDTAKKDSNSPIGQSDRDETLLSKTRRLFRTSPTLAGLFTEVIAFQSLSTILNVCFVRQLKLSMPVDTDRASFTGKFYALVNSSSGLLQFLVLPMARKYLEPRWVYRFMPLLLMPLLVYAAIVVAAAAAPGVPAMMLTAATGGGHAAAAVAAANAKGLHIAALAFFALKSLDYSVRNVANEMVYQPLDFDSRYLGKEVIGVFANRFGKSGSSMILSVLTSFFPLTWGKGTQALAQLSVGVGGIWSACSVWLSTHIVSNNEAEERVQERKKKAFDNEELNMSVDDGTNQKAETKKKN